MSDVVFVQMPFAGVERPSLALGLFTAALREARIAVSSIYGNIRYAEKVGLSAYFLVGSASPNSLLGEWIFAEAAFGEAARGVQPLADLRRYLSLDRASIEIIVQDRGHVTLDDFLQGLRRQARELVRELAEEIAALRPKAVACTSMFDQHVATLALLQAVKQIDPRILTVIGGANCAGSMGKATHAAFPAVDFTVTGEFDPFVVDFFQALIAADGSALAVDPLPPNVLGPLDRLAPRASAPLPPAAILTDMDAAPTPDYDDYFEQLYSSRLGSHVLPGLPFETSRGCWWGAKQHCTFCGLNAEGMAFRKKNPQRAVDEIRTLTTRYGILRVSAADNIIDMSYFQSVLPELAADERKYNIFYETKANLKREHVQALAEAGCSFIQPGIESLHDETLKVMKKGTTACANVQLLKYCIEFGVVPAWSVLCGFPGSDPAWVSQVAEHMPPLFHLPPPNGTIPIRFDRFSPYHQRPAEYGIELDPLPAYRTVYPFDDATLRELAYFFQQTGGPSEEVLRHAREGSRMTGRWRSTFWGPSRPVLVIQSDDGDVLQVRDTRECAVESLHELRGVQALVLRLLESPATHAALLLRAESSRADAQAVERALGELLERHLVWRSSSQYVALPTPPPRRWMQEQADYALGKVDIRQYLADKIRFKQMFATSVA